VTIIRKSKPIHFLQYDKRWGSIMFSNHNDKKQTIASSGCGAASSAMVINAFLSKEITPPDVAKTIIQNGYRTYNNGVDWGWFPFMSKHYGLQFKQTYSTDEAIEALKQNALIIASMSKGYFTSGGHYIMLWGLDEKNKQILVNDPNSTIRTKANYNIFKQQCRNYFIFYEPERNDKVEELKDWQIKAGSDSVNNLVKKGLINNPDDWKQKLGELVPNWLFFTMLDRISDFKGGK